MNGGREESGSEIFHRNMNFERITPNAAHRNIGLSERESVHLNEDLISAAYHGNFRKAEELLNNNASATYHSAKRQHVTALCMAASKNHTQTMQLLLDRGADINAMTSNGYDAVYFAAVSFESDALRLLLRNKPVLKQYVSYGHPVSLLMEIFSILQPHSGLEMDHRKLDVIKILLQERFPVNGCVHKHSYQHSGGVCPDGILSPLIQVVKSNFGRISLEFKLELCDLLLTYKADIDEQDPHGNTALHHAVRVGCLRMVPHLLFKGANQNILNYDGKTAQELTTRNSETALIFDQWESII